MTDATSEAYVPAEDPLMWVSRFWTKAHSIRLKSTYPFARFGHRVSIHPSCEIKRSHAHKIQFGDFVLLDREVWLNVPVNSWSRDPALILDQGANIGRRSVISAINRIHIQENALFAPAVFVTDHNHEYRNPELPISAQGVTKGGSVVIERNCWLGYGSMVIAGNREVVVGRNSVIGAYAVVTESCPPFSVLVGNPARVVKQLDPATGEWIKTPNLAGTRK